MTKAFASVHSYDEFASATRRRWRFFLDGEQKDFLAAVMATATSRVRTLEAGDLLWRAQLGCDWPTDKEEESGDFEPRGFLPARMKPDGHPVPDGRINTQGIPCLYLSTTPETAVAEQRPWKGAYLSVACFTLACRVRLISCASAETKTRVYLNGEPDAAERERACWGSIDRAFARPVARDEGTADYAPTQMLAEMFRREGFDGIEYRSGLEKSGYNIALFDLSAANVQGTAVWSVDDVRTESSQCGNPYVVTPEGLKRNHIVAFFPAKEKTGGTLGI